MRRGNGFPVFDHRLAILPSRFRLGSDFCLVPRLDKCLGEAYVHCLFGALLAWRFGQGVSLNPAARKPETERRKQKM